MSAVFLLQSKFGMLCVPLPPPRPTPSSAFWLQPLVNVLWQVFLQVTALLSLCCKTSLKPWIREYSLCSVNIVVCMASAGSEATELSDTGEPYWSSLLWSLTCPQSRCGITFCVFRLTYWHRLPSWQPPSNKPWRLLLGSCDLDCSSWFLVSLFVLWPCRHSAVYLSVSQKHLFLWSLILVNIRELGNLDFPGALICFTLSRKKKKSNKQILVDKEMSVPLTELLTF